MAMPCNWIWSGRHRRHAHARSMDRIADLLWSTATPCWRHCGDVGDVTVWKEKPNFDPFVARELSSIGSCPVDSARTRRASSLCWMTRRAAAFNGRLLGGRNWLGRGICGDMFSVRAQQGVQCCLRPHRWGCSSVAGCRYARAGAVHRPGSGSATTCSL